MILEREDDGVRRGDESLLGDGPSHLAQRHGRALRAAVCDDRFAVISIPHVEFDAAASHP
eukprot:1368077-Prymnesium_polylepis.1